MSEFSHCFGEIGTLKNTHHLEIKDNITPVVTPIRNLPLTLKPEIEKELKRLVDLAIIEPVQKTSDWVNGFVVVEKPNGKLRICLDKRSLNKAIKREYLHLPTDGEIFSQLSGASYFSKPDASSDYWQIKVGEQSSNLWTFGTPSGRYGFKHLPYGIHSASEVFQREVISIISDILGSAHSQDDFVVWGKTLQECDERLRKVFLKIRDSSLKHNKTECQSRKSQLYFWDTLFCQKVLRFIPQKPKQSLKCPCQGQL